MSYGTIRIQFINNDGGGYAEFVNVDPGTTLQQLFDRRMANANPAKYMIRVNREPKPANYVLQSEDKVSVTPTKVAGA